MTDNKIIEYLKEEIHLAAYIDSSLVDNVSVELIKNTLDLINRQKAEIERLKRYDEKRDIVLHARLIANAKTEAIREFAENVKTAINERFSDEIQDSNSHLYLMNTLLDNLVKEMTEGGDSDSKAENDYKYLLDARIVKRCDKTFEILSTEQQGDNDKENKNDR